jgi:hypothetical protein
LCLDDSPLARLSLVADLLEPLIVEQYLMKMIIAITGSSSMVADQRLSGLTACSCIHDHLLLSRYPTNPPLFTVVPCRSGDHAGIVGPVCHGLDEAMSWLMIMMLR